MWTDVVPLFSIVIFWGLLFVFAFWFSTRALRAPREDDHEAEDQTKAQQDESAAVQVDDQVPTRPSH